MRPVQPGVHDDEEHLRAVTDTVMAISTVMRERKTPLQVGLHAMLTIASKLIVVMCDTEEQARDYASASCDTINEGVAHEYGKDREDFLAFRNKQ